ncbi:MAG: hypothetical protein H5U40_12740 [Polyangiaceae bacterium]|nr:hypothetical protein [Polyangiaceae bacterium]
MKVAGIVVGPEPLIPGLRCAGKGSAVRVWLVGEISWRSGFIVTHYATLSAEAGGGWIGDHLVVEVEGKPLRVPLGAVRFPMSRRARWEERHTLDEPIPEPVLEMVADSDPSKGRLAWGERLIQIGDCFELHGVVEATVGASADYRISSPPREDAYVVRTDLGPCTLRLMN